MRRCNAGTEAAISDFQWLRIMSWNVATDAVDHSSAEIACSRCVGSADRMLARCSAQVVADVHAGEAGQPRAVGERHEAVAHDTDRVAVVGDARKVEPAEFVEQASGVDVARHRVREQPKARRRANAPQRDHGAAARHHRGIGDLLREHTVGR